MTRTAAREIAVHFAFELGFTGQTAEELLAEEKPSTCPPRLSMALSKLRRVRVEGSKNRVASILPSHLWA